MRKRRQTNTQVLNPNTSSLSKAHTRQIHILKAKPRTPTASTHIQATVRPIQTHRLRATAVSWAHSAVEQPATLVATKWVAMVYSVL